MTTKRGIFNTPFHKHQLDASMKKYIMPILCLLTMLLCEMWFNIESFNLLLSELVEIVEDKVE
jgi:hypothetical protein